MAKLWPANQLGTKGVASWGHAAGTCLMCPLISSAQGVFSPWQPLHAPASLPPPSPSASPFRPGSTKNAELSASHSPRLRPLSRPVAATPWRELLCGVWRSGVSAASASLAPTQPWGRGGFPHHSSPSPLRWAGLAQRKPATPGPAVPDPASEKHWALSPPPAQPATAKEQIVQLCCAPGLSEQGCPGPPSLQDVHKGWTWGKVPSAESQRVPGLGQSTVIGSRDHRLPI